MVTQIRHWYRSWWRFHWSQLTGTLTPAQFDRVGWPTDFSQDRTEIAQELSTGDHWRWPLQDVSGLESSCCFIPRVAIAVEFSAIVPHCSSGFGTILGGLEPVNWPKKFAWNCFHTMWDFQPIWKSGMSRASRRRFPVRCSHQRIRTNAPDQDSVGQGPPQPLVKPQPLIFSVRHRDVSKPMQSVWFQTIALK